MATTAWNIRIVLSLTLAATTAARAAEVHYDVFVTSTGAGTKLVIGGYDDAALTVTVPAEQMRVFGGEVAGVGTAAPFESPEPGEPGFRAGTQAFLDDAGQTTPAGVYTALAGGVPLTFTFQPITIGTVTRSLFFWDGDGSVAFAPVAGDVVLGLRREDNAWTTSISGTSSGVQSGNTIEITQANGTVHTHLFTSIAKDGAAPDQGFYLFALQLAMTGYAPSDPLFFVFGALDPEALAPQFVDLEAFETAHGLAETWVGQNLLVVPEPATWLLAACGVAALAGGRRLRRRVPGFADSKQAG